MKKQINTTSIQNDLKGASLFFRPQSPPPVPPAPDVAATPPPAPRTSERPNTPPPERANERTVPRQNARRIARRQSFEIYEDQIERVKRLALEDQLRGGTLSQSEIVRQAIDRYLAELGEGSE